MIHRKMLFALAALLAAAAWAGPATAKPKPPPGDASWAPTVTLGYTETQTDLQGNVLATRSQDGIAAGTTVGSPGGAAALPTGGPSPLACCSSSGCDTVNAYVTQKDAFGIYVVWRYHQLKHWCWIYPSVLTNPSIGAYFSDVDPYSAVVNYDNHGYGYYYTWAGSGHGGHFSERNGSVSNCVFRVGCIGTAYPYVDIWVNGNGAWTWRGGK
jgi:hypothetical protein